jgi:hypothetical protein
MIPQLAGGFPAIAIDHASRERTGSTADVAKHISHRRQLPNSP